MTTGVWFHAEENELGLFSVSRARGVLAVFEIKSGLVFVDSWALKKSGWTWIGEL